MSQKNLSKINDIQNRTENGNLKLNLQHFAGKGGFGGWMAKGCSPVGSIASAVTK